MSGSVDIAYDGSLQAPIHGHAVVTTTSSPLAVQGLATDRITRGILVRAPGPNDLGGGNTAIVFVGGPQVTADNNVGTGGIPLPPGTSITIPCRDPNQIYVVAPSGATTQDLAWMGV